MPTRKTSAAKTTATQASVTAWLATIDDPGRRQDCEALAALMARATAAPATMWGTAIVGFGSIHYRYDSGREGDSCLVGFASRKADISIYSNVGFDGLAAELARLGPHKVSGSCLHIRRFADVDAKVLQRILKSTVAMLKARHP